MSGFLAMSLVLAANGHAINVASGQVLPFTYQDALPGPTLPDNSDAHLEIQQCVASWRPYKAARQKVFDAIVAAGFFRHPPSVLLEVGSSGFGCYGYAVIVDGHLVEVEGTMGGGSSRSAHTAPIQKPSNSITDSAVSRMRSAASRSLADGGVPFTDDHSS